MIRTTCIGEGHILEVQTPKAVRGLQALVEGKIWLTQQQLDELPGRGDGLLEIDPNVCQILEAILQCHHNGKCLLLPMPAQKS